MRYVIIIIVRIFDRGVHADIHLRKSKSTPTIQNRNSGIGCAAIGKKAWRDCMIVPGVGVHFPKDVDLPETGPQR
jgi:hypothetical protein